MGVRIICGRLRGKKTDEGRKAPTTSLSQARSFKRFSWGGGCSRKGPLQTRKEGGGTFEQQKLSILYVVRAEAGGACRREEGGPLALFG